MQTLAHTAMPKIPTAHDALRLLMQIDGDRDPVNFDNGVMAFAICAVHDGWPVERIRKHLPAGYVFKDEAH